MKLVVDTRNGLAGDIMAAGLIGLGADPGKVTGAMESAGSGLGGAQVRHNFLDGVNRLEILAADKPDHLHAVQARKFLEMAIEEAGICNPWLDMARNALEALVRAEGHVHGNHPELKKHFHGHEPVLHEASDIIMDIAGMAAGMMALDIRGVEYIGIVNVGGGSVTFSHGTLDVPTPATRQILDSRGIPWARSDSGMEMATPTGAAILAGCGATRIVSEPAAIRTALAGGTRPLPPIKFILAD
jgi:uncharacterized protein (DUF111 family)